MSREPKEISYSFYVTRTKEMGYGIELDENGNIVSVSERCNFHKGKVIIKSRCRTQEQGDKDFEELVTKCLRRIFSCVNASDLIEALNEEMLKKYFKYVPK